MVESTPRWKWGVQKSTTLNVAKAQLPGTAGTRTWTKHGKLPWVDYAAAVKTNEEDDMKYYEKLADVPAWYQPTVEKLVKKGALNGTGDGVLNVSEDFCRMFTVLDRLGKLD